MDAGTELTVWVKPRASRTRITGVRQGALEVAVAAPPVDNAANGELLRFLAKTLNVPKTALSLARGASSRSKVVRVAGLGVQELRQLLAMSTGAA
jgi:hypothetical protein